MLGRTRALVLLFSILFLLSEASVQAGNTSISDLIHESNIEALEQAYASNNSYKTRTVNAETSLDKLSTQGYLVTYFVDDLGHEGKHEDHSYMMHKLRLKDGSSYRLYFKEAPADPSKLDEIEIEGYAYGNEIAVKSYKAKANPKLRLQGSASASEALGNQATLVAIVRDSNRSSSTYNFSQAQLQDIYFSTKSTSLTSYYQEVSDNRISFSGTVVDTLSIPNLCAGGNIFAQDGDIKALNALLNAGYDIRNYQRISLVVPDDDGCIPDGIAGIGTVGKGTLPFSDGTSHRLSLNVIKSREPISSQDVIVSAVVAHEFGHNLGLPHDNANVCGERIFSEDCPSLEYGGVHSIMGVSFNLAHPNAIHLQNLGWLNSSESSTLSSGDIDQEFTISAISADNSDLKTVKIPRGDGTYYTVEYRRPIRLDGQKLYPSLPTYFDGLLIYLNDEVRFNDSVLLDSRMQDFSRGLSLNSAGTYSNSNLAVSLNENAPFSSEFYDDVNDIKITPISLGDSSASFRVTKGGNKGGQTEAEEQWSISNPGNKYADQGVYFSLSKESESFTAVADKISKISWDFDGDNTIDYVNYYPSAYNVYRDAGTYKCIAKVELKDGTSLTLTSSDFTVTKLIDLSLTSSENSTANELQFNWNKASKFNLQITNSQATAHNLFIEIAESRIRKLIKLQAKALTLDSKASFSMPIVAAPEKLIKKKLYKIDGYYNVYLRIYDSTANTYIYPILKIKGS